MRATERGDGLALVLAVSLVVAACSGTDLPDREADEAAIHALLSTNEAATNRRDADAVVETYQRDADLWIVGQPRVSGLEDIRRNEEAFYGTPGFQSWEATIDSIRFLSRDVALVESSGLTTLESGKIEERHTWVVSRQHDGWRIAAVRIMVFGEQP